jgi:hypothetical protein
MTKLTRPLLSTTLLIGLLLNGFLSLPLAQGQQAGIDRIVPCGGDLEQTDISMEAICKNCADTGAGKLSQAQMLALCDAVVDAAVERWVDCDVCPDSGGGGEPAKCEKTFTQSEWTYQSCLLVETTTGDCDQDGDTDVLQRMTCSSDEFWWKYACASCDE